MTSRRIVPLLLAAAAVSLLWTAPAGAAGPRIICPLITSCCPLPIATPTPSPSFCCEPPATLCLALPTIATAPGLSLAGRPVTVSGLVPGGASGTQVTLWQKLPGAAGFQSAGTTAANSSGQYAFALGPGAVETNREWYVTAFGEHSATIDQRVAAQVTLTRSLHVHVSPNHASERVWLEQRQGAGWTIIARARLNGSSSVVLTAAVSANRPLKLRAVFPGDRRNVTSYSGVIRP